jgi:soluble lytic murein transglycosylase-like protein
MKYWLLGILCVCFASDARAEIVVFKNGRTMSARAVSVEGEMATIMMRQGGEVTFPASIIERIDPDEVPFDSPVERVATPDELAQGKAAEAVPPAISDEVLARRPFAEVISSVAATYDVDARLVHAVIEQESNYQARARSKKARQYGVRNSYDPKANIDAGVRHLKNLLSRLDLPTALAAYNAGEGTVQRYGGLPPYAETQNYVRSILRRLGRSAGN